MLGMDKRREDLAHAKNHCPRLLKPTYPSARSPSSVYAAGIIGMTAQHGMPSYLDHSRSSDQPLLPPIAAPHNRVADQQNHLDRPPWPFSPHSSLSYHQRIEIDLETRAAHSKFVAIRIKLNWRRRFRLVAGSSARPFVHCWLWFCFDLWPPRSQRW